MSPNPGHYTFNIETELSNIDFESRIARERLRDERDECQIARDREITKVVDDYVKLRDREITNDDYANIRFLNPDEAAACWKEFTIQQKQKEHLPDDLFEI